jgi:hypothetical protein
MDSKSFSLANQVNFTIRCAREAIASRDISNFHKYGYHADRLLEIINNSKHLLHPNISDAETIHIALRTISFTAKAIQVNNLPCIKLSGVHQQLLHTPPSPTN